MKRRCIIAKKNCEIFLHSRWLAQWLKYDGSVLMSLAFKERHTLMFSKRKHFGGGMYFIKARSSDHELLHL